MAQCLVDRTKEGAALALTLLHGESVGNAVKVLVLPAIVARHALYIDTVDHGSLTRVMPGLVPGIHAFLCGRQTWMAGTSPVMTKNYTASADFA